MSVVRAPNHPATFNGHFQPIADYSYVKTTSFFQCGGINSEKNEDFEVELITNTALNNTLTADSIYSLSGKLIALNDGSTPILSYFQDTVVRVGPTGQAQPDFTNKSTVTSLGMVTSRREVASNASDSGSHLEVIVVHCDWDGQERVHRRFNIKYIVPGTKNLVKTHTLYQVGREINIIGRLVDFHMEDHMAVVVSNQPHSTPQIQLGAFLALSLRIKKTTNLDRDIPTEFIDVGLIHSLSLAYHILELEYESDLSSFNTAPTAYSFNSIQPRLTNPDVCRLF
ncbi:hypothetical protein PGTUg99_006673 [Puccinia graminis f. sp. tritici]|uniref:Uncharacterized protein n=1 Tax=Puccinia graminis f. sp. tritici TaxID=56615 RepID=A0A5B0RWW6_PUCGR|nr:hypothetical protein PGTUg99_006673 [Puccinia graminis f. sp. tritici]